MEGWIKLHRKLVDWEWYSDNPVKIVFIHLLLTANYAPKQWQGQTVETGEKVTSIGVLAEETGLTIKQVRLALNKLENTGEIIKKGTNKFTLIKVVNYSLYQDCNEAEGQSKGNQRANEGQTKGNQRATNKKNKNIKNNKNDKNILEMWNDLPEPIPKIQSIRGTRATMLKSRIAEYGNDKVLMAIKNINDSTFLKGKNDRGWVINFDWFIRPNNFVKVLENNYVDKQKTNKLKSKPSFDIERIKRETELNDEWDI